MLAGDDTAGRESEVQTVYAPAGDVEGIISRAVEEFDIRGVRHQRLGHDFVEDDGSLGCLIRAGVVHGDSGAGAGDGLTELVEAQKVQDLDAVGDGHDQEPVGDACPGNWIGDAIYGDRLGRDGSGAGQRYRIAIRRDIIGAIDSEIGGDRGQLSLKESAPLADPTLDRRRRTERNAVGLKGGVFGVEQRIESCARAGLEEGIQGLVQRAPISADKGGVRFEAHHFRVVERREQWCIHGVIEHSKADVEVPAHQFPAIFFGLIKIRIFGIGVAEGVPVGGQVVHAKSLHPMLDVHLAANRRPVSIGWRIHGIHERE